MIKFGTGGWRAIIGDDFIRCNIEAICGGLTKKMKDEGVDKEGIVIGFDNRFLSEDAAKWCAGVFAAGGVPVSMICRPAPTPLVMFTVKTHNTPYGLAITASHNPAQYNGIKIFTRGGRDASREITDEIEKYVGSLVPDDITALPFDDGVKDGIIRKINPFNQYIDSIISMIDMETIKNRELRVLLDPMYGVSKTCLQTILLTCRCNIDVINDRHDTLFGGRLPSPSSSTLHKLSDMVVERGYDIGIATDGDADRLGIIDSAGTFIHPNDILVLLYYYLLKYKGWSGPAVRNIATTHLLDRLAHAFGQECYEVPVGFKWISAAMEKYHAIIGGESSGGLTVRGHIDGKDGVFAAAILVEMICRTGKSLHELITEIKEQYGTCEMAERDFRFDDEKKRSIQKILFEQKAIPEFFPKVSKVSYLDGLKVYFENDGWIICRFSGTEPLLRIYCEMPDINMADQTIKAMTELLEIA